MITLSEEEYSELVTRLNVTETQLKCIRDLVFREKERKPRAKSTKAERREALLLEISQFVGASILNYK